MSLVQNNIRDEVKELYLEIENSFSDLIVASSSNSQKEKIIAIHSSARDAYWKAMSERLEDNNLVVKGIRSDLKALTAQIKADLKDMQDLVSTINILTEAVRLAGSVVALAAI